jgi:DNA primase large subunit
MSGIFDLVKRYPWLPSLKECYPKKGSKGPIDFINEIFSSDNNDKIKERILEFFKGAFNKIEDFSFYMDDETNIDFYIGIKIFLSILNNKLIANRIAELYSKITFKSLNKEINNEFNLYYIYKDLNLDVVYSEEPAIYKKIKVKDQDLNLKTKFRIHYIDYLNLASNLKDNYRKLVNNSLHNGYVFIQPDDLNRLIQEYVRIKFLSQVNIEDLREGLFKNQVFKNLYDTISELWEEKKEDFEYSFDMGFKKDQDVSKFLPPCIQEILAKVKEGQNLVHTERLGIVWFLNALKYPEEEIINLFSSLPDFDRDKTGYQVRYAIKKGYIPYSCKTLKSYNLCMAKKYKDKLCLNGYFSKKYDEQKKISHPLFYVQFTQFVSAMKKKNEERYQKSNNE